MAARARGERGRKGKRRRRFLLCALLLAVLAAIPSCFPGPVRELWPPQPGERSYKVDVVFWDWHTLIIEETEPGAESPPSSAFREWGYCEEAWYLEGKQGVFGAFRALGWPSAGGVQKLPAERPYWKRHPDREIERWSFVISEKGRAAMHAYLESELGEPLPGHPSWHRSTSSYHVFHSCHHFTASALREAGLPIRPWWAFAGWMVGVQLDRVARFHAEEIPDATSGPLDPG